VVSDFLAPTLAKAVYPTAWLPRLEALGYRIDTDPWAARQSLDAFLEDFRITAEKRAEAVIQLMDEEDWDLFMVVFMETDRLHHFMWQYMEENDPAWGPKFLDAYRQIDALAGRIVAKLSADDDLIVLSDHGFTTLKQEVYLNVWLEQQGYLSVNRANVDGSDPLSAIEDGSRVYSLDPGRMYLNLASREPRGTVATGDVDHVLEEVSQALRELRDPSDGLPIIQDVFQADEIYHGPERRRAPDLLVMPHDGYDLKGSFDATELMTRGKLIGMHKYDNATLFVRGRQITVDHASVRDVLPTACYLLGIDCPSDVDGSVIIAR